MPPSASLLSVATKLAREADRADAAERRCVLLASQLRALSDQRDVLQLRLDKTQKELDLYKIQLDLAQQGSDPRIYPTVFLIPPFRHRHSPRNSHKRTQS